MLKQFNFYAIFCNLKAIKKFVKYLKYLSLLLIRILKVSSLEMFHIKM